MEAEEEEAEEAEEAEAEEAEEAEAEVARLWRHRLAEEYRAYVAGRKEATPTTVPSQIDDAQAQGAGSAPTVAAPPSRCQATPRIMNYYFPPQLGKQSDHVLPGSPVYTPAARLETTPWERTLPPRSAKVKAKDEVVVYLRDRRSGERTLVQGEEFAP